MNRLGKVLGTIAITGTVAAAAYVKLIRPWHLKWGATADELKQPLPGDEIVPRSVYGYTRAITIDAPPDEVWPWIAQIGQGRGGFYSYEWLENLVGCDIHNADRIVPEFQLSVGDKVYMYPEGGGPPPFTVVNIEPGKALVLGGGDQYSWVFVLKPIDAKTTRLIARARAFCDPSWLAPIVNVEPITFIMEQKMLRGIKERAERP